MAYSAFLTGILLTNTARIYGSSVIITGRREDLEALHIVLYYHGIASLMETLLID